MLAVGYREVNEALRDAAFRVPDAELRERWEEGFADHSSKVMLSRSILERNEPDHSRMRSLIAGGTELAAAGQHRTASSGAVPCAAVHLHKDRFALGTGIASDQRWPPRRSPRSPGRRWRNPTPALPCPGPARTRRLNGPDAGGSPGWRAAACSALAGGRAGPRSRRRAVGVDHYCPDSAPTR